MLDAMTRAKSWQNVSYLIRKCFLGVINLWMFDQLIVFSIRRQILTDWRYSKNYLDINWIDKGVLYLGLLLGLEGRPVILRCDWLIMMSPKGTKLPYCPRPCLLHTGRTHVSIFVAKRQLSFQKYVFCSLKVQHTRIN